MWDKTKRQRFSTLRERARQGALTPEEQMELRGLYRHLEEMEASSFCLALNANDMRQKSYEHQRGVTRCDPTQRGSSGSDASDSCPVPHGTRGTER